jgi:hypothetical protein
VHTVRLDRDVRGLPVYEQREEALQVLRRQHVSGLRQMAGAEYQHLCLEPRRDLRRRTLSMAWARSAGGLLGATAAAASRVTIMAMGTIGRFMVWRLRSCG